jgi:FixJ family two-component response regulator
MPESPFVAIVDDDESIRITLKDLLESAGLQACVFTCAEHFLKSARLADVTCAIADMRMPGMSGLEMHEHLAAAGRAIPMILMTAYPDEPVRARALGAGVAGYLVKPFTDHELLGCIKSVVRPDNGST